MLAAFGFGWNSFVIKGWLLLVSFILCIHLFIIGSFNYETQQRGLCVYGILTLKRLLVVDGKAWSFAIKLIDLVTINSCGLDMKWSQSSGRNNFSLAVHWTNTEYMSDFSQPMDLTWAHLKLTDDIIDYEISGGTFTTCICVVSVVRGSSFHFGSISVPYKGDLGCQFLEITSRKILTFKVMHFVTF